MKDLSKLEWKTLPKRPGGEHQDYMDFWKDVGAAEKDTEFKFAEYRRQCDLAVVQFREVYVEKNQAEFDCDTAQSEDPDGLKLADFFRKAYKEHATAKTVTDVWMSGPAGQSQLAAWAFEGKSLWLLFAPEKSVGKLKFREETDDEVKAGFFSESEFLGGELTDYWKGVAKAR